MRCHDVWCTSTLVARRGTLFYSSFLPRQQPFDIAAVCFSHEKDPRSSMTCGHISSASHLEVPGPVWWCQHTVWYGTHSELRYSPVRWLLFLPLRSAIRSCPPPPACLHLSCFYSCWPALLCCSLSWQWAVVCRAAGMLCILSWEGIEKLGPRLTQVTLGLEAQTGGRQEDRDVYHIFISPSEYCH